MGTGGRNSENENWVASEMESEIFQWNRPTEDYGTNLAKYFLRMLALKKTETAQILAVGGNSREGNRANNIACRGQGAKDGRLLNASVIWFPAANTLHCSRNKWKYFPPGYVNHRDRAEIMASS